MKSNKNKMMKQVVEHVCECKCKCDVVTGYTVCILCTLGAHFPREAPQSFKLGPKLERSRKKKGRK